MMQENQHIEWKESWREEYLKWICGFANADGGMLVLGRNDKGSVVGIHNARKLMIWNPGQLPPDWTLERLLGKHSSHPFNPDVANAFFRAGMIEAWGRGIERIMQECETAGVPEPELRYERTGLWTVFYFLPEHAYGTTTQIMKVETPVETPVKTPDRILEMLKENPELTLADVAKAINKSLRAVEDRKSTRLNSSH